MHAANPVSARTHGGNARRIAPAGPELGRHMHTGAALPPSLSVHACLGLHGMCAMPKSVSEVS